MQIFNKWAHVWIAIFKITACIIINILIITLLFVSDKLAPHTIPWSLGRIIEILLVTIVGFIWMATLSGIILYTKEAIIEYGAITHSNKLPIVRLLKHVAFHATWICFALSGWFDKVNFMYLSVVVLFAWLLLLHIHSDI